MSDTRDLRSYPLSAAAPPCLTMKPTRAASRSGQSRTHRPKPCWFVGLPPMCYRPCGWHAYQACRYRFGVAVTTGQAAPYATGWVIDLTAMRSVGLRATIVGHRRRHTGPRSIPYTDAGRAPVTGSMGAVGLAGLTLGGGYGALVGRYGLASDNLVGAEVVLADGQKICAPRPATPNCSGRCAAAAISASLPRWISLHRCRVSMREMRSIPSSRRKRCSEGASAHAAASPDDLGLQIGIIPTPNGPLASLAPTWIGDAAPAKRRPRSSSPWARRSWPTCATCLTARAGRCSTPS